MIRLENLSAGYPGKNILRPASLAIPDNQLTIVIGPNGSGKSTLLKTIAGILPPTGGSVLLSDAAHPKMTDLSDLSSSRRAQLISYLPQSRNVPEITAFRMVLHGRFPYLGWPRRYREPDREIARKAMEETGAWELRDRRMPDLSGGERQKVYLAMVLAQDTPNILLDEPTTYLDISHQLGLMQTARNLAEHGRCVVMILHDITLAMQYADWLLLIEHHTASPLMTPDELFQSHLIDRAFGISLHRFQTEGGYRYYL